jgi:acetyl-CoA carboxylase biotin carboxyl carrier protein
MTIEVTAPMVGKIVKILVEVGQEVAEDDPVIMLEAMKVEMPVVAPEDGKVTAIKVKEGDNVEGEQVVVEIEED